jgi:DNA polymerase III subunit gamma/tau
MLRTPALVDRLAQSLTRHLGENVKVEIAIGETALETPARAVERATEDSLENARRSLENDPTIQAFQEKFGATLRTDTVKPNH